MQQPKVWTDADLNTFLSPLSIELINKIHVIVIDYLFDKHDWIKCAISEIENRGCLDLPPLIIYDGVKGDDFTGLIANEMNSDVGFGIIELVRLEMIQILRYEFSDLTMFEPKLMCACAEKVVYHGSKLRNKEFCKFIDEVRIEGVVEEIVRVCRNKELRDKRVIFKHVSNNGEELKRVLIILKNEYYMKLNILLELHIKMTFDVTTESLDFESTYLKYVEEISKFQGILFIFKSSKVEFIKKVYIRLVTDIETNDGVFNEIIKLIEPVNINELIISADGDVMHLTWLKECINLEKLKFEFMILPNKVDNDYKDLLKGLVKLNRLEVIEFNNSTFNYCWINYFSNSINKLVIKDVKIIGDEKVEIERMKNLTELVIIDKFKEIPKHFKIFKLNLLLNLRKLTIISDGVKEFSEIFSIPPFLRELKYDRKKSTIRWDRRIFKTYDENVLKKIIICKELIWMINGVYVNEDIKLSFGDEIDFENDFELINIIGRISRVNAGGNRGVRGDR